MPSKDWGYVLLFKSLHREYEPGSDDTVRNLYYNDPISTHLLGHILCNAQFKDGTDIIPGYGKKLKRGQYWTSYEKLATVCGCAKRTVKRCLDRTPLKNSVDVQNIRRYGIIITVKNYSYYQSSYENGVQIETSNEEHVFVQNENDLVSTIRNKTNKTNKRVSLPSGKGPSKAKKVKEKTNGMLAWDNYLRCHLAKYNCEPIRNAKVNSALKRIGESLSVDAIPLIFDFYYAHPEPFYQNRKHSLEVLEKDLNKLMTEMKGSQPVDNSAKETPTNSHFDFLNTRRKT